MSLSLLVWRREVSRLYAEVRGTPDPAAAWLQWRSGRDALLREHPDSPFDADHRREFHALPFADYDPALRIQAGLDTDLPALRREVPTASDGVVPFLRLGRAELPGLGSLDVWWLDSYGGGVFVPLHDGTSGTTTYGGGRYLLDTVKGADLGGSVTELVLDLNFAYHPSCAYDPRWSCPLAPEGNRIAAPISAGEQLPAGGWY